LTDAQLMLLGQLLFRELESKSSQAKSHSPRKLTNKRNLLCIKRGTFCSYFLWKSPFCQ